MPISSYKELVVWQKAMQAAEEVYRLVRFLPKEELYALSNQMRRAAVSIPSNIAEGQARSSKKEFINFLSIAKGSMAELETQVLLCVRMNYLQQEQTEQIMALCDEIGKMLSTLIVRLTGK